MPFASVNGLQLHYEVAGAGPLVMFLHGLGSSADDWALQAPAFRERHRMITLDLRGHGRSHFRGRLSIPQMADDVAGLLAQPDGLAAGPGGVHVVGLSLGGCVAITLGILRPDCVRSLTLVNTFARYQPPERGGVGRVLKRMWLLLALSVPEMAKYVARGLFPKPEQRPLYEAAVASLGRNSKGTYLAALLAIRRFDARAGLGTIHKPTLVVLGDRDQTVPRAAGEALCRGIPGAQRLLVADSGHATPMDQPEVFNRAVLDFLAQH